MQYWEQQGIRRLTCSLSGHTGWVLELCYVREGVFVSGSWDKSLIIWSKSPESYIYSHRQTLTGSESPIAAIIRIHNTQIVSGEYKGDLRIWDIDQGICTKHIPSMANSLYQMKQNIGGEVLVSCHNQVNVWDTTNNWENTPKQFSLCDGRSIEFFSQHLLLRGGWNAHLEFIHYRETVCKLPPTIRLHSAVIFGIQKIVQNILLTASMDGYLKVIEPISGECYLKFKKEGGMRAIAYFY